MGEPSEWERFEREQRERDGPVAGDGLSQVVRDLLADVPSIEQPNIYPMEWHGDPQGKLAVLYERAKREVWNPAELPWAQLDPKDFTREQRLGVMYWYSVLANFDGSGPPVFAKAMIHSYEQHEPDPVRKCFFSITRDEASHMAICLATLEDYFPKLSDEDKALITKQLRAGFVFLSMILYEPPDDFWKLPPEFLNVHRELEAIARRAGLGVATLEVKREVWRQAMFKVKAVV